MEGEESHRLPPIRHRLGLHRVAMVDSSRHHQWQELMGNKHRLDMEAKPINTDRPGISSHNNSIHQCHISNSR